MLQWHLYLPIVGGTLNVPVEKNFFLFMRKKENHSSNPADLAVRSFLLSHLLCVFFFFVCVCVLQWSKGPKSNFSYKKQDNPLQIKKKEKKQDSDGWL